VVPNDGLEKIAMDFEIQKLTDHKEVYDEIEEFLIDFIEDMPNCNESGYIVVRIEYFMENHK